MNTPENALKPRQPIFAEAWHAQTLAAAEALTKAGAFTPSTWTNALGAALKRADAAGKPDTEETYYLAALEALEQLAPMSETELAQRKSEWTNAYLNTRHGDPVELSKGQKP